ncbi:MAG: YidH family protein [Vulcanimicrobiaceae bacterium]
MAYDRTRVAYERTMLAWIRTATSLITFGFTVYKLFDVVEARGKQRGFIGPHEFGLVLVCMGLLSLVLAAIEYRQSLAELGAEYHGKSHSTAVVLAILVGILGIVALIAILLRE